MQAMPGIMMGMRMPSSRSRCMIEAFRFAGC